MDDRTPNALATVPVQSEASLVLFAKLDKGADEKVKEAKSKSSRRAYASDWRSFTAWCEVHGLATAPALDTSIARYLQYLFDEGVKVSTIKRALSGIGFFQQEAGFDWAIPAYVREQMKGIRRARAGIDCTVKKDAATGDILRLLVNTCGSDLRGMRDRAIMTVQWMGAYRRSEVVYLNVEDVTFKTKGMEVMLWKSKTDQEGKGAKMGLMPTKDLTVCPITSLQQWLKAACIETGPLFRRIDRRNVIHQERLTDRSVADIIKKAAKKAGLDEKLFSGHSMRSGFITTAAQERKSIDSIMVQSRHKSVAIVREYIQHATVFIDNAGEGLL